ncbi:MAG: hypothetical protein ABFS32_08185 [Bacteroidota bacterium]
MTIFKTIIELVNIEGSIISLLKCEEDKIYFQAKSESKEIICPTTAHTVYLYLTQISLIQAFLMSESEPYIIIDNGNTTAHYLEFSAFSVPDVIANLTFGDTLFQLIPKDSRTQKSIPEIMALLPEVYDGLKITEIEDIELSDGNPNFFSDDAPISIVQLECQENNPYNFEYLKVKLLSGENYLLCRVSPFMLKLLFTGMTIKSFFMAQSNKEFYQITKNGVYKQYNSTGLQGMFENLWYGYYSYFNIPAEFISEQAIELLGYYERNIVLPGGYGQQPVEFEKEYPVEIQINRA